MSGNRKKGTYQIRLPQTLAHAEQLVAGGAAHDEVLGEVDAADGVEAADEGLAGLGLEAGHDGGDEVGTEAALVEGRGDEVGESGGGDVALLAQAVHVDLVAEQVRDGGHVGGQARQAQEHVAVLEDLGEVVGYRQGLQAQPQVARHGHAVLAHHGYAGAAVCRSEEVSIISLVACSSTRVSGRKETYGDACMQKRMDGLGVNWIDDVLIENGDDCGWGELR